MIYDDMNTHDDGQETPDRKGSSVTEGDASEVGGPEVGVGVGGSRLQPRTKPPAYNTTLGLYGTSVPGATNEAGNLASTCGTSISLGKMRTSAGFDDALCPKRKPADEISSERGLLRKATGGLGRSEQADDVVLELRRDRRSEARWSQERPHVD